MRTDCTIDNRAIPCPNASSTAGGRWRAKAGDMITCNYNGESRIARVLGRVSAPTICDDKEPVKGFALVMMLSDDGTFAYERWVDPKDITRVYDAPAQFAAFFFAPKLPYDAQTMRKLMAQGTLCESYVQNAAKRASGDWLPS